MRTSSGATIVSEEQHRANPDVTEQWEREKREQQRKTRKEPEREKPTEPGRHPSRRDRPRRND